MSENGVVRCRRCNRVLTDPTSVKHQLGPVCYLKIHGVNMPSVGRVTKLKEEDTQTNALWWFK